MIEGQKIERVRNVDAEGVVIGAMLTNNKWIDRFADLLRAEDFYEPLHGDMFAAIVREAAQGRSVTPITVYPYFKEDQRLAELDGTRYFAALAGRPGLELEAEGSALQVKDMAKRRLLIDGLTHAAMMAADMNETNEAVIAQADGALADVSENNAGVIRLTASQAYDRMLLAYKEPSNGVTCGSIPELDQSLGPIGRHHLVVCAGRPGMGKTALAVSYALGAARKAHGVLFVSLEMKAEELMQRATADVCFDGERGVPYDAVRDGNFKTDWAWNRVRDAAGVFSRLPLSIIDASSLNVGALSRDIKRMKRRMEAQGGSLDLVIVDYLQLLNPDHRCNSRYEAVTEISRALKSMAKQHDVGIMALAQLNRDCEKRSPPRPETHDLKESGQIEQDADAIVLLYRDEYYLRKAEPAPNDPGRATWEMALEKVAGQIDMIVAKRRNGPAGLAIGEYHLGYQAIRGRNG